MSEFFIARHGQSEWNLTHRIQGQTNTQLSLLGLRQSQDLYRALKDQPLTDIFTSKLDRSIKTAEPLTKARKIPIQISAQLNELAFGQLTGKFRLKLKQEDQAVWDWWMEDPIQRRIPGGESYQDLYARISTFLANLGNIDSNRSILIVGHLRVNQVLLGCLGGLPLKESITIRQPNDWLYNFREGSRIRGAKIPSLPDRKLSWQDGLLFNQGRILTGADS